MTFPSRFLFAMAGLTLAGGIAHASSATFRISAVGVDLGEAVDADAEIPEYRVKVREGETLTLVADGVVLPRGGAPSPGTIDAGAWLFDDEAFKLAPAERAKADKTKVVIALTALKAGTFRVRFVGDILGRYHKYDVWIGVTAK